MTMEKFAAAMREARARKKMSQKELSEKSGVATSTISSYENGGKVPPLDIAAKLARVLEISIDEIWGINGNAEEESSFGRVIHAIETIMDTDIAEVKIEPTNRGFRVSFAVRGEQFSGNEQWLSMFAEKWNVLLEGQKNDEIFKDVYRPWIEAQIKEANRLNVVETKLPF